MWIILRCLFIADAVTPNGDGYNDEWIVGGLQDFLNQMLSFTIVTVS